MFLYLLASILIFFCIENHITMVQCGVDSGEINFEVTFKVDESTDPYIDAQNGCKGAVSSCSRFAKPLIEIELNRKYARPFKNWRFSDFCQNWMPQQDKLTYIQHFHIPKTSGTSLTSFLFDYMNCNISRPTNVELNPCENNSISKVDVDNVSNSLLCNGTLLACSGHRVHPNTLDAILTTPTNAITMIRNPFHRLVSDYFYILRKPNSTHLSPEVNISDVLLRIYDAKAHAFHKDLRAKANANRDELVDAEVGFVDRDTDVSHEIIDGFMAYISYPGISNCMTKMLNGIQCGEPIEYNSSTMQTMVSNAKLALLALAFVGVQEYFNQSLCLFNYMYGGDIKHVHGQQKSRVGVYPDIKEYSTGIGKKTRQIHKTQQYVLTKEQHDMYQAIEQYDIEVYEYGLQLFKDRMRQTTLYRSIE